MRGKRDIQGNEGKERERLREMRGKRYMGK